ncbi:MAG: TraR/DksA C4-type zinc finger protein, partial [Actinomycetota bacterium]
APVSKPAPARAAAKKTAPAKAAATKAAPTKAAATKAAPAKGAAAKGAAKKTAPVKVAPAKASAKKAAPAKAAVKKAAQAKAAVTKAAVKKAAVKKVADTSTAAKKAAPAKTAVASAAAADAGDVKVATATAPAPAQREQAPSRAARPAAARSLKVREDESPWTAAELAEVQAALEADVARLGAEIATAETGLHELLRDSGDGAGDDQADAGAKTFEREQEISLANNSREMLDQSAHALAAIADGTYGVCESCGLPVGKMRLQAFPRATLCVSCKSRQERR